MDATRARLPSLHCALCIAAKAMHLVVAQVLSTSPPTSFYRKPLERHISQVSFVAAA